MPRGVVMLGSGPGVRGGVSAMVEVLRAAGHFDRWETACIATHCDGSALRKAAVAALAWLRFAARLATGRVALLHVNLNSHASFWRKALFIVPARLAGVPVLLHVHCGRFPVFVASLGRLRQRFARWLVGTASAVVVLSGSARAELRRVMPNLDAHVIPNPVAAAAARVPPPVRNVLFLGALTEAKGLDVLLEAWRTVVARFPDARLVLGGAGDIASWQGRAASLGIADSVTFAGWVAGDAKEAAFAGASLLVLPSRVEAMPMVALEAMARAVPVVASAVGAIPEMLGEGRCGVLVPVADPAALAEAILRLLRDPGAADALGQAGRRQATAEHAAERIAARVGVLWRRFAPECERMARMDYARAGSP